MYPTPRSTCCLLLFSAASCCAAVTGYDESVSGDLSNSGATPTAVTVAAGSNIIMGTTGRTTAVDRDYFTITIPSGHELYAIVELAGTSVGGAVSFIGAQAGPQVTVATNAKDATGLLGWWHYGPVTTDTDILPAMSIPAANSSGFSVPLGAGTYSFWIQDFGAGTFKYAFDFRIRPVSGYDESVSGDLSNSGLNPTVVRLSPGSNILKGTTGRVTGVDRDYFRVTVPAGFEVFAVKELAGTSVGGAVSFIGVQAGPQVTLPTNTTSAAGLLGWSHYGAVTTDTDILPSMGVPADGSTGFTGPLGPGQYTFWIQDFGAGTFGYAFDFQMRPVSPMVNLSARAFAGTGDNALLSGFVITGDHSKTVLVRACGPALTALGVSGALPDPALQILDAQGNVIASDTGWGAAANANAMTKTAATVGAFPLATSSGDSAILMTVPPGQYFAKVAGASGDTGVAIVEVYDADPSPTGRLANVSVRSPVGPGDNVLITGFVVTGTKSKNVLIRAVGPTLSGFGVSKPLPDPALVVYDSKHNQVGANTGWANAANATTIQSTATSVGAFGLGTGAADSAVLLTLAPGAYTAVASGASGDTGVALLEVYSVDAP